VPRTFAAAGSGYIVNETGWFPYFMICVALSIPGMLLLPKIAPWRIRR
jgi:PAT family beta-lactamase induction signal transducer AmpG